MAEVPFVTKNIADRMTDSQDPILVLLCLELFMFATIDQAGQRPSEERHESVKLNQDKNMAKLHIQSFSSLHLVCGFSAGRSELKPDIGPYFYSSSDSEGF